MEIDQSIVNWVFAAAFGMVGWIAGRIMKTLDHLDSDVRAMPEKYVLKTDYSGALKSIDDKLEKIFDKLDGKADKK